MEMFTDRLRTELEIDEGCKYHIYLDHLGLPTAGIGHLIKESDPEHGKPVGTVISKERVAELSLIHISEPTRPERISYAVF